MSNSFKKGEREAEKWNDKQKALMVPGLQHEVNELREQLAKQEKVIRELTSSLTYIVETLGTLSTQQDELEALAYYEALRAIQKAKSLTTKDKSNLG